MARQEAVDQRPFLRTIVVAAGQQVQLGISGRRGQELAVPGWNDVVAAAVQEQQRAPVLPHDGQVVEWVADQEARCAKAPGEGPDTREGRFENQGGERAPRREPAGRSAADGTAEGHDPARIDARAGSCPVVGGQHGLGDRRLRGPARRTAVAWILDQQDGDAPTPRLVERRRPEVDQLAVAVREEDQRARSD
jgi:hypothetical protein